MFDVPPEPELPEWLRPPVRKVSLPEAQAQLSNFITVGYRLASEAYKNASNFQAFLQRVAQWREHTGRWLTENLGGLVADEFTSACAQAYADAWRGPSDGFFADAYARQRNADINAETRVLTSIDERLPQLLTSDATSLAPSLETAPGPVTGRSASGTSVQPGDGPDASSAVDPRAVMVIYGHDIEANDALFDWLRRIGLKPLEFSQLVLATGSATPYTGDAVRNAFDLAQAVIAFFTPDEHVLDRLSPSGRPGAWRLQARPNVLIEAGMALITHPDRTVLALLGPQELPSDLAGRHYIQLSHDDPRPLHDLATRLRLAGCETDLTGTSWLDPQLFPNRTNVSTAPPAS